jgi:hypothetical protein
MVRRRMAVPTSVPSDNWQSEDEQDAVCRILRVFESGFFAGHPPSFVSWRFNKRVVTFASLLRLFLFPHATAACATPISLLSPTHTPLRCPAFSSSPPSCCHLVESTEGPNTQTRQGLTSNSTARLQMEDRRAGHRGGWGRAKTPPIILPSRSETKVPTTRPKLAHVDTQLPLAMAAWESLLAA